eukprot:1159478-Pelagomonas_calceolata.AAC.5
MQPHTPKGQGFLFDMRCTEAEGFGGFGSACWRRELQAWREQGSLPGKHAGGSRANLLPEEGIQRQVKGTSELAAAVAHSQEGQGAWVGRLSEPMEVSEDTTDETMEEEGE